MKKIVLLVASLLAVSTVATAEEVQVKEVIKEVPVEKIVYRDRVVEVAKSGANGTFEVSYKVPFYKVKFDGEEKKGFAFIERNVTLVTKAEVEVSPKHKVRAETETSLELIPHKEKTSTIFEEMAVEGAKAKLDDVDNKIRELEEKIKNNDPDKTKNEAELKKLKEEGRPEAEKKYNEAKSTLEKMPKDKWVGGSEVKYESLKLGYNYAHSDFVSVDTEFSIKPSKGRWKTIKIAPKFNVKDYFFDKDYSRVKEISVTPAYSYTWDTIPTKLLTVHEVSLSGAAKFVGPYESDIVLDLENFVVTDIVKKAGVITGNAGIYVQKDFELYNNDKHNINLDVKGGYKLEEFTWYMISKGKKADKLNKDKLYIHPTLTYNYKLNDYSKLYAALETEISGEKNYRAKDRGRVWGADFYVKAGLKVSF